MRGLQLMSQPKPSLNYDPIQNAPTMWRSGFKQQFRTISGKGQEQTNISPEQLPDFASEQLQDWQKQQPPVKAPTLAPPTEVPIVPMDGRTVNFEAASRGPISPPKFEEGHAVQHMPVRLITNAPAPPIQINPSDEFATPQVSPRDARIEQPTVGTPNPFNRPPLLLAPPPSAVSSATASTVNMNSPPPSIPSSSAPTAPSTPRSNLVDLAPRDLVVTPMDRMLHIGNLAVAPSALYNPAT